jgi:hypothetical protein
MKTYAFFKGYVFYYTISPALNNMREPIAEYALGNKIKFVPFHFV